MSSFSSCSCFWPKTAFFLANTDARKWRDEGKNWAPTNPQLVSDDDVVVKQALATRNVVIGFAMLLIDVDVLDQK